MTQRSTSYELSDRIKMKYVFLKQQSPFLKKILHSVRKMLSFFLKKFRSKKDKSYFDDDSDINNMSQPFFDIAMLFKTVSGFHFWNSEVQGDTSVSSD